MYSGMAMSDTFYLGEARIAMGVHRIRSGSVGRPFTKGNPGGGRPKGAQNKATLEIKEFARNFLMSDRYQRTLERRGHGVRPLSSRATVPFEPSASSIHCTPLWTCRSAPIPLRRGSPGPRA